MCRIVAFGAKQVVCKWNVALTKAEGTNRAAFQVDFDIDVGVGAGVQ